MLLTIPSLSIAGTGRFGGRGVGGLASASGSFAGT